MHAPSNSKGSCLWRVYLYKHRERKNITDFAIFIQVYVADIEGHEGARSSMNECAYYVISKAGGTPYGGAIAEKQKHLNDRWRALCQQLGITYKKAEETRYGLKLLEIQLKQLNTWMAELESRLVDFTVACLCVETDLHKKVKEIKVQCGKLV